jgi:hypothetical protein
MNLHFHTFSIVSYREDEDDIFGAEIEGRHIADVLCTRNVTVTWPTSAIRIATEVVRDFVGYVAHENSFRITLSHCMVMLFINLIFRGRH